MKNKRFCPVTSPKSCSKSFVSGQKYRFTVLTAQLIRMEFSENGEFVDLPSQSVFFRDFPEVTFSADTHNGILTIKTDELILTYNENEQFCADTLKIRLINEPASEWCFGEDYEDEGGTAKTLDEIDGNVELGHGVCSRYGFAVLDDKDRMLLNEHGWVVNRKENTEDSYFFGFGYDYFGALKAYYKLTGAPPLLPAYALGNWWSRYHRYTQDEYTELMLRFKKEGVPFSVGVVDMDWHTTDVAPEEKPQYSTSPTPGWTGYTWNTDLFPDHVGFLKFLHDENIKTSLNLHPADGIRKHEGMYREMAEAVGIDPDSGERICLDILNPEFMEKYFDIIHHPYEDEGVDFWWMDWQQGTNYGWIHEPNKDGKLHDPRETLDPLWMLNHLHILDISRNGKRPMFFSRFSGPGSHRYPVGFSGDTVVSWKALNMEPHFTATASNIGYGWWSHDIGGHQAGYRDDELTVRWMQFGVFSPINRLHSTKNEFSRKEPWCYEPGTEAIIKKWLRLRHELFPYIYTMNYRNHSELIPLMLPMYYTYPKCKAAYEVKNQYWFGSELIVAPITEHSDSVSTLAKTEAWLPKGHWFDFFEGIHYISNKGRKINMYRSLDKYPVLAKAGAIVPLQVRDASDNRLGNSEEMQVVVFPGADNSFTLYEDEGDYNKYQNGEFAKTEMQLLWDESAAFTIKPAVGDLSLIPEKRKWRIALRGFNRKVDAKLSINGKETAAKIEKDNSTNTLYLIFTADVTDTCEITITGENLMHDNCDWLERAERILQFSQLRISTKNEMYELITAMWRPLHSRIWRTSSYYPEQHAVAEALHEMMTLNRGEFEK